ncbi:small nuclear RNA activating complex, polypeptide 3 [Homalodisca vitripennis]|nr:small nuclear RNA activating complex, polypeptide 3 [Homalodisca vitripennis]
MVSFRIHDPFSHTVGDNSRPGSCSQQINVLGQQFLTALKDKIVCESDFQDTRGDVSEQPDAPVTLRARELYESSMFYFDNTFYIDTRNNENVDYSKTIKEWGTKRGILFGGTKQMERTLVEDLEIRFGYPYLYLHQGCCEHVVIINDARLLTPKDSLFGFDYPLMTKVSHKNLIHCMTCSRFPAKLCVVTKNPCPSMYSGTGKTETGHQRTGVGHIMPEGTPVHGYSGLPLFVRSAEQEAYKLHLVLKGPWCCFWSDRIFSTSKSREPRYQVQSKVREELIEGLEGWIVRGSDRLAHDPTYQCKTCFKLLHYKNGKKIGKFTAYQYWQRSTIL